jgi:hypothetical protein
MVTFETVSVDGTKLLGGPGFTAAAAKFAHHDANGGRVDLLHCVLVNQTRFTRL